MLKIHFLHEITKKWQGDLFQRALHANTRRLATRHLNIHPKLSHTRLWCFVSKVDPLWHGGGDFTGLSSSTDSGGQNFDDESMSPYSYTQASSHEHSSNIKIGVVFHNLGLLIA